MKRPFSKKYSAEKAKKIDTLNSGSPLPIINVPVETQPQIKSSLTHAYKPLSLDNLQKAKMLLDEAGIDSTILDRLVEKIKSIDKEIDDLKNDIEIATRRIKELEEYKDKIYKILANFMV